MDNEKHLMKVIKDAIEMIEDVSPHEAKKILLSGLAEYENNYENRRKLKRESLLKTSKESQKKLI